MPPKPPKPPRQPGQPIRTERDRALGEIDVSRMKQQLASLDEDLKKFKKDNKVVEVQVALGQRDQLVTDLAKVNEQLGKAKQATEAFKSAWQGVTSTAQQAAIGLATSAVSTATAGGRSNWGQIHSESFKYRHDTQAAATAAGKSFEEVGNRISLISTKTSRMSSELNDYTRDVARMTGSWDSAADGVEAFSARARQVDKPLLAFTETAGRLANVFGIKSKHQVLEFFGTLDAQAKKVGITATAAANQWDAVGASLMHWSPRNPGQATAISTYFAAHSANATQAASNATGFTEFVNQHAERMNWRHVRSGKPSIYDEYGNIKDQNAVNEEYVGRLHKRFGDTQYGRERALHMLTLRTHSRPLAVATYDYNAKEVDRLSKLAPSNATSTADSDWQQSAAGRGDAALARKNRNDIDFGVPLLGASDYATAHGGGGKGLLLGAGTDVANSAISGGIGLLTGAGGALALRGAAPFTRTAASFAPRLLQGALRYGPIGAAVGLAAADAAMFPEALDRHQWGQSWEAQQREGASRSGMTLKQYQAGQQRLHTIEARFHTKPNAAPKGPLGSLENPVNLGTVEPGYKDLPHLSKSIVSNGEYGAQVQSSQTGPQDVSLAKGNISDLISGFKAALHGEKLHVVIDTDGGLPTEDE